MIPTLAQLNPFVVTALVVLFLVVCIAMILLILIQRPQGGGLSGAFGAGGGAGQTAFGTKTGDVLTLVTITIFVLFLVMAVVLNFAAWPAQAPSPETVVNQLGDQGEVPADSTPAGPAEGAEEPVPETPAPESNTGDDADGGSDVPPDPAPEDGTP